MAYTEDYSSVWANTTAANSWGTAGIRIFGLPGGVKVIKKTHDIK